MPAQGDDQQDCNSQMVAEFILQLRENPMNTGMFARTPVIEPHPAQEHTLGSLVNFKIETTGKRNHD